MLRHSIGVTLKQQGSDRHHTFSNVGPSNHVPVAPSENRAVVGHYAFNEHNKALTSISSVMAQRLDAIKAELAKERKVDPQPAPVVNVTVPKQEPPVINVQSAPQLPPVVNVQPTEVKPSIHVSPVMEMGLPWWLPVALFMQVGAIIAVAIMLFLMSGCGKKTADDVNFDFAVYQARRDALRDYVPVEMPRCDHLTAWGMVDAYMRPVEIYLFESKEEPGKWNRDVQACYPDDSKSECSPETEMSAAIAMGHRGDRAGVRRQVSYLDGHNNNCGAGPFGLVNMWPVKYLLWDIGYQHTPSVPGVPGTKGATGSLEDFRGYVGAQAIELAHIRSESLIGTEAELLKVLIREAPDNPVVAAYEAIYQDGDEARALSILDEVCPEGVCGTEYKFGWSSIPDAVVYCWTVGVLESQR